MDTTTFQYTDPREFEGSPFDAARGAAEQAESLIKLAKSSVADTFIIARVAELQRQQDAGNDLSVAMFDDSPIGKRLRTVESDLGELSTLLARLAGAVSYDPMNPPKEA